MRKRPTALGFEAMEDRVVFSASLGGVDYDSSPYMEEQGILQGVDDGTTNEGTIKRLTDKGFGFIESEEQDLFQKEQTLYMTEYYYGNSNESESKPLLIIAEDIEGEALAADSSATQDGLSNTFMVGEVYRGVPYHSAEWSNIQMGDPGRAIGDSGEIVSDPGFGIVKPG